MNTKEILIEKLHELFYYLFNIFHFLNKLEY